MSRTQSTFAFVPSFLLLGAALTGGAVGCGSGSTTSPDAPSSPDAIDAGEVTDGEAPSTGVDTSPASPYCTDKAGLASVTDVSGTWAIRALATQVVVAPLVNTLRPQTLFYMLVNITQSGTNLVADGRYCDRAEIDQPSSPTKVVMPDAWAHTEKLFARPGTLVAGGDGIPVLTFPTLVEVAGAILPNPATDPLPTDPTDPAVFDEDHDGNPGITLRITGLANGVMYVDQRQTTAISAIPVAPDRFLGKMDFTSQQNVLDSDPTSLKGLYEQGKASPDATLCSSTFTMVKVASAGNASAVDASAIDAGGLDGGTGVTCEWLRTQEAVLFPQ